MDKKSSLETFMVDDVEPQQPGGGPVGQRGVRALESGLDHRWLAPWVEGPRGLVRQSQPE